MHATGRNTMEKKLSGSSSIWNRLRGVCAFGLGLLFMFVLSGTAFAQNPLTVSGTVTSTGGAPLPGVTVRVQGGDARAVTDASGKYRLTAPADAVLTFSLVGQR